jgi:5-methylthioadenosine/S-adenosylhomocysteine deaminase
MTTLALLNCDVLQVVNKTASVLWGQDILVDKNKIEKIVPTGSVKVDPAAEKLEARGLLAMPGLINTHAHTPMVYFRGLVEDVTVEEWFNDYIWPMESNLTGEDVYWGMLLGLAEMIECGVTTVADHYFYMDQEAQAVRETGTRANLAWAVFGHQGEEGLNRTVEFIRKWHGGADGRIITWLGPHAPYTTTPDFLRLVAQKAGELGVGIHIHVSETADQVKNSLRDHGMTPVKLLQQVGVLDHSTLLGHCSFATDEDRDILTHYPAGIAQAPKTYMKHGVGLAPVVKFLKKGIPVGLASDGAASNNTLDILEQMRLMVLSQRVSMKDPLALPQGELLDLAFHGGAKVSGFGDSIGDLKEGKLADIALIRQDGLQNFPCFNPAVNLVFSVPSSEFDTVVCDGKVLMHKRELKTIDKKKVKQEISKRLERMTQRVKSKSIAFYPS